MNFWRIGYSSSLINEYYASCIAMPDLPQYPTSLAAPLARGRCVLTARAVERNRITGWQCARRRRSNLIWTLISGRHAASVAAAGRTGEGLRQNPPCTTKSPPLCRISVLYFKDYSILNSVKQEFQYSIKLRLFDDRITVEWLKIVLLPFDHYCRDSATQPRVRQSSFQSLSRQSTYNISNIVMRY